jgi:hypothetical protein
MPDTIAQLCQVIAEKLRDKPESTQAELMTQVEAAIAANPQLKAALKADSQMLQTNQDGAKGFQTLVEGGVANIGDHYHLSDPEKLQTVLQSVIQNLLLKEQSNQDYSKNSFLSLLNWIQAKSKFLGLDHLSPHHRTELLQTIDRVSIERFDFREVEIKTLDLVSNYIFFCLENRLSPKFKRMTKKEYQERVKKLLNSEAGIRRASVSLSSLINDPQMSKLVKKLEELNAS